MKVLLTIEGGFAKTLFEGIDKGAVEWFLKGFQYARKMNLESPEVIGVLNELMKVPTLRQTRDSLAEWQSEESRNIVYWATGALSAMENSKGKLEVVA
jgi:hypothetical protein